MPPSTVAMKGTALVIGISKIVLPRRALGASNAGPGGTNAGSPANLAICAPAPSTSRPPAGLSTRPLPPQPAADVTKAETTANTAARVANPLKPTDLLPESEATESLE